MKDNKIDDLFREKLAGHAKLPSPMAWEKLNNELTKKERTSTFLWWHKAAVIVLVCVSGFLIINVSEFWKSDQSASTQVEDSKNETKKVALPNDEELKKQMAKKLPVPSNVPDRFAENKLEPIEPKATIKIEKGQNKGVLKTLAIIAENTDKPLVDEHAVHTAPSGEVAVNDVKKSVSVAHKPPPVTIEYRSGKRRKEETLVAGNQSPNESQSFTFKKLVATVKDMKEGEIGLADLRQAKDDLFVLETYKGNLKSFSNKIETPD